MPRIFKPPFSFTFGEWSIPSGCCWWRPTLSSISLAPKPRYQWTGPSRSYWKKFSYLRSVKKKNCQFVFVRFFSTINRKCPLKLAPKQIQSDFFYIISLKVGFQMSLFSDRILSRICCMCMNFTMICKMCSWNRFEVTLVAFVSLFPSVLCKCLFKILASRNSRNFTLIA